MKIKLLLALLVMLAVSEAQEAEIIDFTYTHVLTEGGSSAELSKTGHIMPDSKLIFKHTFPEICDIKDKLDEGMDQSSLAARSIDVDQHLRTLRGEVVGLLRVMEEMKVVKASLEELEQEYEPEMEGFNSTHFTSDLKRLADKQLQLSALRTHIEKLTLKLNTMIEQYNLNPKNQQFNVYGINYKIQFADRKIEFYENLKTAIRRKKSQQSDPINYTQYFSTLNDHFQHVNEHLNDIDNAINNYARKKVLEEKIASWNNKIEIEKLLLNEKIDCNNSKGKIKTHNHFNEEIKKTFEDLRQKKKEFDGMNNTQCEGVAKKLEEKIRSELKITNRAFLCSEGLEETQQNLVQKERELESLKRKLEELNLGDLEVYKRSYNKTVDDISKEFEFMKTFAVDEYVHSEKQIDALLDQAKQYKENAERQLKALPDGSKSAINYKQLQGLVQEIKREKAKYCKQFSEYEHDSREVWSKLYREEKREGELAHLRSQYLSLASRFVTLEAEYHKIGDQIISYLESHDQKA